MADAVIVLREEIATLEQEITKRRQALTILAGAATPTQSPAAKSPASPPSTAVGPSLVERLVTHLTANKGKLFTSMQITEVLAKTDKSVTRANVQRRLSDLFSRKQVTREDGHYGVA